MLSSNTSGVSEDANYIESVFSTYLYTGNGGTQTITNNIDLSTKGGMVWLKSRSLAYDHDLFDTVRGAGQWLGSNSTAGQVNVGGEFSAFTSSGFTITNGASIGDNANGATYASWTFRKQPKFFDVVTYTGTGSARTIAHSLGSTPGCIMVKRTDTTSGWNVYHRSLTSAAYELELNTTSAQFSDSTVWNSTAPTSNVFSVGTNGGVNANGGTYVAYIFAHDAGGFGLTGTDNVISCGSFTDSASTPGTFVNLGWEPQYVLYKRADGISDWHIMDNMRGFSTTANGTSGSVANLYADANYAESVGGGYGFPTATGFYTGSWYGGAQWVYIAIRRGPMKVPTDGTKVFQPYAYSGTSATRLLPTGITEDMAMVKVRNEGTQDTNLVDRLRGPAYLKTDTTAAEAGSAGTTLFPTTTWNAAQTGLTIGSQGQVNDSAYTYVSWNFKRAPSFFDEVCYTGTGSYPFTITHNLGVVPELIIFKKRSASDDWWTYAKPITSPNSNWYQNFLRLNGTSASASDTTSLTTSPTSTTIPVADYYAASGSTYVAYLFATCPGVSKVGSYTGTGTTKQVDCGFAAGARFVLIKRTDSTGDWYVWDTARGIVSGNDPYLLMNSTAAEVTSTDYIDTYSAGFELSSTAPAALNASGGTYIFLAIA